MRPFVSRLFRTAIAASALLSGGEIQAQSRTVELSNDEPMNAWPAAKRPRMEAKYLEVEIDGPPEKRIKVTSDNKVFVFEDEGRWLISRTITPRYSILWNDRLHEDVTFGIAQFAEGEFLASLEDKDWKPYLESIRNDVIPKKIVYEHYTAQGKAAPYILKNWTRKVEYEYPLSNEEIGKTREIFTFIEGELFVFIFSGKKELIDANRNDHNMFLSRMNVFTDS